MSTRIDLATSYLHWIKTKECLPVNDDYFDERCIGSLYAFMTYYRLVYPYLLPEKVAFYIMLMGWLPEFVPRQMYSIPVNMYKLLNSCLLEKYEPWIYHKL